MLTHPKAPPDAPPPVQGLGHVVKPVLHRQPVTPAAAPTPCPQPGEAPARPAGLLTMLPIQFCLGCQAHGQRGVGTAGDQARTVPGLSLVQGLQTGLAVQVSMER